MLYSCKSYVINIINPCGFQVAPFIDGVNHVCKISELSKLDIEVVAACIQNLM